jgi:hypothetical protein
MVLVLTWLDVGVDVDVRGVSKFKRSWRPPTSPFPAKPTNR